MNTNNPFTLNFGLEPSQYISRKYQADEVINNFTSDPSPTHVYMITGVRGSGKTVMLSEIEDRFKDNDWLTFDLSIESDLLKAFAAKLYNEKKFKNIFVKARIDLSYFGLGIELGGNEPPFTDLGSAIEEMLEIVARKNKKILITIDETVNSASMRRFASEFQILLRKKYPVYLLMTGLYENIYELQNVKTLTFLYRAPRIALAPLNAAAITESYKNIFAISKNQAQELALLTKGYPYAYQVTGYLCWDRGSCVVDDDLLMTFDEYMNEYVYSKIWDEQSPNKKKILTAMADTESEMVTEIRRKAGMTSAYFSVYRTRLIRQGLVRADGYGRIVFVLPRFECFIKNQLW